MFVYSKDILIYLTTVHCTFFPLVTIVMIILRVNVFYCLKLEADVSYKSISEWAEKKKTIIENWYKSHDCNEKNSNEMQCVIERKVVSPVSWRIRSHKNCGSSNCFASYIHFHITVLVFFHLFSVLILFLLEYNRFFLLKFVTIYVFYCTLHAWLRVSWPFLASPFHCCMCVIS